MHSVDVQIHGDQAQSLGSYLFWGTLVGLGMGAWRAAGNPLMSRWLGLKTGEQLTLARLAENPDLSLKYGLRGAADFALTMPFFKMAGVPAHLAVNHLKTDKSDYQTALKEGFKEFMPEGSSLSEVIFKSMGEGAVMGLKLGPGLGIFQMPSSALFASAERYRGVLVKHPTASQHIFDSSAIGRGSAGHGRVSQRH